MWDALYGGQSLLGGEVCDGMHVSVGDVLPHKPKLCLEKKRKKKNGEVLEKFAVAPEWQAKIFGKDFEKLKTRQRKRHAGLLGEEKVVVPLDISQLKKALTLEERGNKEKSLAQAAPKSTPLPDAFLSSKRGPARAQPGKVRKDPSKKVKVEKTRKNTAATAPAKQQVGKKKKQ